MKQDKSWRSNLFSCKYCGCALELIWIWYKSAISLQNTTRECEVPCYTGSLTKYRKRKTKHPFFKSERNDKCLINLVFLVRVVEYGSLFLFSHRFMTQGRIAWAINRGKKNSLSNMQYGPWTRLITGMLKNGRSQVGRSLKQLSSDDTEGASLVITLISVFCLQISYWC